MKSLKFRKEKQKVCTASILLFVWDLSHKTLQFLKLVSSWEFCCFFFPLPWKGLMELIICRHQATMGDGDMGFLGFWIQELSSCLSTRRWIYFFQGIACVCVCVYTNLLQSYSILCNPMDHVPPGSSTHGIFKQEYCSGWPCPPPPGDLPHPWIESESLSLLHWQADFYH